MKINNCFLIIAALCSFSLSGQKVPTSSVAPVISSAITPAGLTEELDDASANSRIYFHAKEFTVDNPLTAITPLEDGYYYRITAQDLSIKVFLNIGNLLSGDTLFVLNSSGKRTESLFRENLYANVWSSMVYRDELTLYYKNTTGQPPNINIEAYSLELPKNQNATEEFGDSGPCEVNVNCSEGNRSQDVKKGVARILIKNGSFYSWCTGTLVNNTARDCRMLLMTAEHCGLQNSVFANAADINRWEFDFNYEAPDCANISSENQILNKKTIVGAKVLARSDDSGGDDGSDFILLELTGNIPSDFNPYFVGWNRVNTGASNGVVIHHPQGDTKKISTYTNQAVSGEYGNTNVDTHWLVNWAMTANGQGVTEGGSSGSALLDGTGLITGMLTGGSATCNAPSQFDYFGKISYSWKSNGTAKNRQLAPWLDPKNTGELAIIGSYCGDSNIVGRNDIDIYPTLFNLLAKDTPLIISGGNSANLIDVQIFDLQGKLKYRTDEFAPVPGAPREIDMSNFSSGVYFVRIVGIGINKVTKIVIAN